MSNALKISGLHPLKTIVTALVSLAANEPVLTAIAQQGAEAPGIVKDFAGPENKVPSGYLLCDGSEVSRTTYAALFDAIGTTHGPGNGTTTFNLPDLRGRVVAGVNNMGGTPANRITTNGAGFDGNTLGAAGGAQVVTLTADQSGLREHSHVATSTHSLTADAGGAHTHNLTLGIDEGSPPGLLKYFNTGAVDTDGTTTYPTDSGGTHSHSVSGTIATTVSESTEAPASQAHNNVQPTMVLNKIIKT